MAMSLEQAASHTTTDTENIDRDKRVDECEEEEAAVSNETNPHVENDDGLSGYERLRLEKNSRNEHRLGPLGLLTFILPRPPPRPPQQPRPPPRPIVPQEGSSRIAGQVPRNYNYDTTAQSRLINQLK